MKRIAGWWNRDINRAAASMRSVVVPVIQTIIGVAFAVQVWSTTWPVAARTVLSAFFAFGAVSNATVALRMKRRGEPQFP